MSYPSPIKHRLRTDVPGWLANIDPASLHEIAFPLRQVLENSLYYPAAGLDGRPVQFLGGFIHSFVYVDYGTGEGRFNRELASNGFAGYRVSGRKLLSLSDFNRDESAAGSVYAMGKLKPSQEEIRRFDTYRTWGAIKDPFSTWFIFDREPNFGEEHGPARFSFTYIGGDGVATYQALYCRLAIAPRVLAIIQPGDGFGLNYTRFRDPCGLLARTVLTGNGSNLPEYLVCGESLRGLDEAFWPKEYPEVVERFQFADGNGIWRRRPSF